MTYAIHEGFFPQLIASFTLPMLAFLGVFSIYILSISLLMGAAASYWLVALLTLTARKLGLRTTLGLVPSSRRRRWFFIFASAGVFLLLSWAGRHSWLRNHDPSALFDVAYYLFTSFVILCAFSDDRLPAIRRVTLGLLAAAAAFFILPQTAPETLAEPISLKGFRSGPDDLLIVDDKGHQNLIEQLEEAGVPLPACSFKIGQSVRWRLTRAVAVWTGAGKQTFLKADKRSGGVSPTLTLPQDELTVLSGASKPPCL